MKKVFTFLAAVLLAVSVFAQTPEKMSYQAVIRNSSDQLVTDTQIGMQISILQGSASGTAVYVETQTPTTNANGLVSVEIGTGTVVSGTFASIDWSTGSYFIKTETDPTGETSYSITGTSQLLSVPFALHAKTAENFTGTITETDPVFGISVANGITEMDTTNWNNKLDTEVDGSVTNEIQTISRTNLTVTLSNGGGIYQDSVNTYSAGTGIDITNNVISTTSPTPLAIGDSYGGGIIFWLDASGQHGLVAATTDQSTGIKWYNGSTTNTGATLDGVYAGKTNTNIIIANQGEGSYAAQLCADYSVTVDNEYYDDWYLPSKYELNLLYLQKAAVGGFTSSSYWSSTEKNSYEAWVQIFNGAQKFYDKFNTYYVRAVRAF